MTTQTTASTTSLSRLQELLPQLFQATQRSGQPYLRCLLTENLGGLIPLEQVQESLIVPVEQITALPNMPRAVIGLLSSRERVFCVVNLPQVLGDLSMTRRLQHYRVIVVRVPRFEAGVNTEGEALLGLAVPQIQGVTRLSNEQIHTDIDQVPAPLKPYVIGSSQQDGQLVYLLSSPAVALAPTLHPAVA